MLAKRIIPCLDVNEGRVVKGINFVKLRDAGDPVECGLRYSEEGADELVFLDITASVDRRNIVSEMVRRVADSINIPFTVGGGLRNVDDIQEILRSGADKVSLNTSAVQIPASSRKPRSVSAASASSWQSTRGGRMAATRKSTHMADGRVRSLMPWNGRKLSPISGPARSC